MADDCGGWCEKLLTEGEDVNSTDQLGWTPLMHAVHDGCFDLARDLLSQGANASLCNQHGVTAFTIACKIFDEDLLRTLYEGLPSELKQQESDAALLVACSTGSYDTVKWLLQSTLAQVNAISPLIGVTPLMMVAMGSGDCDIAGLLLRGGADPSAASALGQDVLELALASGNTQLYSLLTTVSPSLDKSFSYQQVIKTDSESTDPMFTANRINLDVSNDTGFKNSPNRPVFKNSDKNISDRTLFSPTRRNVFLLSPQRVKPRSNEEAYQHNLDAIVTPCRFVAKTQSKAMKRKRLNGISSWFKKITKRRSKSLADEDDFDDLPTNGVHFLKLLKDLKLEEFYPIFKEQELDIWTFLSLTVQDLAAMGIDKASAQIRILAGIQQFRTTQIH